MDTQTHAALVERLKHTYGASKVINEALVNPDGPEAAQVITTLSDELTQARAEIARMREVLELLAARATGTALAPAKEYGRIHTDGSRSGGQPPAEPVNSVPFAK